VPEVSALDFTQNSESGQLDVDQETKDLLKSLGVSSRRRTWVFQAMCDTDNCLLVRRHPCQRRRCSATTGCGATWPSFQRPSRACLSVSSGSGVLALSGILDHFTTVAAETAHLARWPRERNANASPKPGVADSPLREMMLDCQLPPFLWIVTCPSSAYFTLVCQVTEHAKHTSSNLLRLSSSCSTPFLCAWSVCHSLKVSPVVSSILVGTSYDRHHIKLPYHSKSHVFTFYHTL
jgi:hypothetical protein